MSTLRMPAPLDAAIEGSRRERFVLELLGNSAVFPLANILLELFLAGGPAYFLEADFYAIVAAALAQAAFISRTRDSLRGPGNLVGPAIYTAIEAAVEGTRFFTAPHHLAYWGFALAIGALQAWRMRAPRAHGPALLVAESVVRSAILFVMYAIYEKLSGGNGPDTVSAATFFADPSHRFIAWAVGLLGLVAGLAAATSQRYLDMLRELSRRLRTYSEWFFGPALLEQAVAHPETLALARRERAVLFMDVRGFTAWSESQPPETVVAGLGAYYESAEEVFLRLAPVRSKFSGDEVMAVYADAGEALAAARSLAAVQRESFQVQGLAAGIGLHWGPVVEGLIGGRASKQFDVIGDTVNTAKRIEGAAAPGEILASEAFRQAAGEPSLGQRSIQVKGKSAPLAVHRLEALTGIKPTRDAASVT